MRHLVVLGLVLGGLLAASRAGAQAVPYTVAFTGRLADGNGPISGSVDMTFSLFDAPSGGTMVWQEAHAGTGAQQGLVFVTLGSTTPLDENVLIGAPLFLEVTVQGEVLTPRTAVASVPYAVRAAVAGTADDLAGFAPGDFVTSITAGAGLTGGGAGGDQSLAVSFGGSGAADTCARSDHDHAGDYLPVGSTLTCAGTDKVTGVTAGGDVICAADVDTSTAYTGTSPISVSGTAVSLSTTGCVANEAWFWNGTAWACQPPPAEVDAVIGNEITAATNATLTRSGGGTTASPYTLALNLASANSWTGAQTFSADTNFPFGMWQSDGLVGVNLTAPQAALDVFGVATRTGTGNVSGSSGSTNVTGVGTVFLSEFAPGDLILIPGVGTYIVAGVTSDTALALAAPLVADAIAATFTYRKPTAKFARGALTPLIINAANNIGINTVAPRVSLEVAGAIYSSGATGGSLEVYNPANQGASVGLNWQSDVPRIRWGGSGAGASNGFRFQGVSDADKLVIRNNGDLYLPVISSALILRSPDGSCYRLTVANGGALATAVVTCP